MSQKLTVSETMTFDELLDKYGRHLKVNRNDSSHLIDYLKLNYTVKEVGENDETASLHVQVFKENLLAPKIGIDTPMETDLDISCFEIARDERSEELFESALAPEDNSLLILIDKCTSITHANSALL